ncbi:hypothetical protein SM0020_16276 [Sinorhizobium meliloti CCNWSX0020]|uniref:Uncharacterized protein n=1 Tax=Sinorhizobium meliloti CCNWSX0020 TaxID=1107881 RepID=H0G1C0_RHIML|nr:hypothetical protein SM0020_16276 [Sinorhizobium meliloti CCNWSX0020]
MLRALVFMLFATAAVSASAAGRTGDSRFLVKAWVQKFDNSFEHVTGWCDGNDLCTLELAGHELRLNFSLPETAIASASTPILTLPPPVASSPTERKKHSSETERRMPRFSTTGSRRSWPTKAPSNSERSTSHSKICADAFLFRLAMPPLAQCRLRRLDHASLGSTRRHAEAASRIRETRKAHRRPYTAPRRLERAASP